MGQPAADVLEDADWKLVHHCVCDCKDNIVEEDGSAFFAEIQKIFV